MLGINQIGVFFVAIKGFCYMLYKSDIFIHKYELPNQNYVDQKSKFYTKNQKKKKNQY